MVDEPATPWYFRRRATLFGVAYGAGFFFGFFIAGLLNQMEPSYARLGDALPVLGPRGAHLIAVLLVVFGWAWRVWGTSYLSGAVVWSDDLSTGALHVAGPYGLTRNPLYFGNIAIALGVGMLGPPSATGLVLIFNVLLILALVAVEERSLERRYGSVYQAYAHQVPRLFPRLWPSRRAQATEAAVAPDFMQGMRSEAMSGGFVVAMLVGYVTQRPLSLVVGLIFGLSIVVSSILTRDESRTTAA
jgi:protein-S-isoprenylcysteine O-methyltransferase Ste14